MAEIGDTVQISLGMGRIVGFAVGGAVQVVPLAIAEFGTSFFPGTTSERVTTTEYTVLPVGSGGASVDTAALEDQLAGSINGSQDASLMEGVDLRDLGTGLATFTDDTGALEDADADAQATSLVGLALRILALMMRKGAAITSATWNRLPGWAQAALTAAGIVVGSILPDSVDLNPFDGGTAAPALPGGQHLPVLHQDIPGVHLGAHVIGSWNTNPANPSQGVTFYRLSDGKLAVQNKKGRWKVWRPKKPIVLFADGAKDLKTMLRADKALSKQAKGLAAMLNRRAPKPRRTKEPQQPHVVAIDGKVLH